MVTNTKKLSSKKGQALMELAIGMLALALILAATFGFISYMISSLDMQRKLRADAGKKAMNSVGGDGILVSSKDSTVVKIEPFAAEYIFNSREVTVKEQVFLPTMKLEQ